MKDSAMLECPFCHQFMVNDEGKGPQDVCDCDGAKHWRFCRDRQIRLDEAVIEQFGDECGEFSPSWIPLPAEHLDALRVIAEWVAFEKFDKATLVCADGSTCVITPKQVCRSKKLSAKTEVS